MILVSCCHCLCPIIWSQVFSRSWRCSWSSACDAPITSEWSTSLLPVKMRLVLEIWRRKKKMYVFYWNKSAKMIVWLLFPYPVCSLMTGILRSHAIIYPHPWVVIPWRYGNKEIWGFPCRTWWLHDMETLSTLLAGGFSSQRSQWYGPLLIYLLLAWTSFFLKQQTVVML